MRSLRCRVAVVLLALVAAGCGSPAPRAASGQSPTTSSAPGPTSTTLPPTSTSAARAATTIPPTTAVATPAPTPTTTLPDARLRDVGSADQAVIVTASAYGATTATLTAYERTTQGWRAVFGPWTARVGTRGVAPPGAKREGDGRTPSGVYGFDFFFGVAADPGVHFPYRRVTGRAIVWDDDPASASYNLWRDTDVEAAGADPEPMYTRPAYDYGAVIAYNTDRAPGLGSAIFLHVSTGGPTAGCVSLPPEQLLQVLRWLDPGRLPRIVLGVAA